MSGETTLGRGCGTTLGTLDVTGVLDGLGVIDGLGVSGTSGSVGGGEPLGGVDGVGTVGNIGDVLGKSGGGVDEIGVTVGAFVSASCPGVAGSFSTGVGSSGIGELS